MELDLGLPLPRAFHLNTQLPELFDEIKPALPLGVSWNHHPDDNDEPNNHQTGGSDSEDEDDLVGWPPIQSWRRKHQHYHHNHGDWARPPRSMYVKVKMEGVAIGRKVNINRYHSHLTLTASVIALFEKYTSSEIGSDGSGAAYVVNYQDREGNWLLARDVPWQFPDRWELITNVCPSMFQDFYPNSATPQDTEHCKLIN